MPIEEDIEKFKKKTQQALDELQSKKNLDPIAKSLAEIIRRRTRLGYGVESAGSSKEKLAPLAVSTKGSRRRKKKAGNLSDKTAPNKSNLTESGEMLDAIEGRAINKLITVSPKGERNKKLTSYHQLGRVSPSFMPARKFLNLGFEDVKQLTAVMQDKFSEILDKVFGKK